MAFEEMIKKALDESRNNCLLLFVDNKGRILTCGTSPSHAISQKTLEDAVYEEANEALQKIGFKKEG